MPDPIFLPVELPSFAMYGLGLLTAFMFPQPTLVRGVETDLCEENGSSAVTEGEQLLRPMGCCISL